MKNILAFGDSLTWGYIAGLRERHPFDVRWPNVLAAGLDGKARVIEEGHNGRTTVFDDPTTLDDRNGANVLPVMLSTHQPLDLVIILLGTNDIKFANRCRAFDASMGMGRLVQIVQTIAESKLFATHYARVAQEMGVHFFDAGAVAKADPTDGGHLDAANTKSIGTALVPVVKRILKI